MLKIAKKENLALCLSPYLGGLGFPLPTSKELRKRRSPSIRARLFARVCLDHPQDRRIRRLTDFLIGKTRQDCFASTLGSYYSDILSRSGAESRRQLILLGRLQLPQWHEESKEVLPNLFYSPWYSIPVETRSNVILKDFISSYIRRYRPKALSLGQLSRGTVHANDYFARCCVSMAGFE